jgi:peptidoglycan/xylan/chitin deacetylase (PgdA/CDA1 family)
VFARPAARARTRGRPDGARRRRTGQPVASSATALAPSGAGSEPAEVRALAARGGPVYCAGRQVREVALTFDDGPGPYTRLVLRKLRKHHLSATFFVVARNIPHVKDAAREERLLGAVGDHTFTHPLLTELSLDAARREMAGAKHAIEGSSDGPVFLFRPPYGARDAAIDGLARNLGLLEILWTVDSRDSLGANWAQIERNVIAGLHPGAIILMHENRGQTVRALLGIFAALARKHLRAVSVPQLLSDDPPGQALLRSGGGGCGAHAGVLTGS